MMVLQMLCSPRMVHHGLDFLSSRMSGLARGMRSLPSLRTDLGRGQARQVGAAVAVEEVEDVVPPGVGAGREGRPRDRGDRREGGAQTPVAAPLGEPAEVRQLALGDHPLGDPGILAVEAEEDRPLDQRLRLAAAAHHPPQGPKRPGQDRDAGQEHGDEQDGEGAEDREAGPGPDVGLGGGRQQRRRRGRHDPEPDRGSPLLWCWSRHRWSVSFARGLGARSVSVSAGENLVGAPGISPPRTRPADGVV